MFHNGFEWPLDEMERFHNRLKEEGWPEGWVEIATSNHQPWVYYLSREFIAHAVDTIERTLEGIGAFQRQIDATV